MPRPIDCRFFAVSLLLLAVPAPAAPDPAAAASDKNPTAAADARTDPEAGKFFAAIQQLQSKKPADLAAGRAALQELSNAGYTHAQALLGNCLLSGSYGFSRSARKGADLFRLAGERGNAYAKLSFGQCLVSGVGVRRDPAKAQLWLTAALAADADYRRPVPPPGFSAGNGSARGGEIGVAGEQARDPANEARAAAHFLLAGILTQQKKNAEAQEHCVAAATMGPDGRDGLYPAAVNAALAYAFGNGVPQDLARADEMLNRARKLGSRLSAGLIHNYVSLKIVDDFATADLEESADKASDAAESMLQYNIANSFADRKSKQYNLAEAAKWYELAAEDGRPWAMIALAFLHVDGSLGPPDPARAFAWFEKAGRGDKPMLPLAAVNLAICYENGYGTARDPAKAAAIFQRYRQTNYICYLGTVGQAPAVPQKYEQILERIQTAAGNGDPYGEYFMGMRYLGEWDVKRDVPTAVSWFEKAAKANVGMADTQLGLVAINLQGFSLTSRRSWEYFQSGIDLNEPDSMAQQARLLEAGRDGLHQGSQEAEALALRCLQLAPDHVFAHRVLGQVYEDRLLIALRTKDDAAAGKNRALMLAQYEAAYRLKDAEAARHLWLLFSRGEIVPQDHRRAYESLERAAEWGAQKVHSDLAKMHELGQGVPVTLTEAAYHYRIAALQDRDSDAMRKLSLYYAEGKGVDQDYDRATFWMIALGQTDGTAMVIDLGDLLIEDKEYEFARRVYEFIAKFPQKSAQALSARRLGQFYDHGWGVAPDAKLARQYAQRGAANDDLDSLGSFGVTLFDLGKRFRARRLWEEASAQGHVPSELRLGTMYATGDGVERDVKRALPLLTDASQHGDPAADVALGRLTLEHAPEAPDVATALKLVGRAVRKGYPPAKEVYEKLLRLELTPRK